MLQKMPFVET